MSQTKELVPRSGSSLRVIVVSRISTDRQDERSLSDQTLKCQQHLKQFYKGHVVWKEIASRVSGEILDRAELDELMELIQSRQYDVLICEETSRILRRWMINSFIEACEDSAMRFIAINDRIDTGGMDDWRVIAGVSAIRHELANRDTADRVRRSMRSRFQSGGACYILMTAYLRERGKNHESDISKDPAFEPIIEEIFARLEREQSFAEIADWLNETKVIRSARSKRWTAFNVRILVMNPILKGVRVLNRTRNQRVNSTGRRKRVRTDESEQLFRNCPHLAFIDPDRYDRVISRLRVKNKNFYFPQGKPGNQDFTKRTIFPGQCVTCGVCGRKMVYCLSNTTRQLSCYGSKNYECWNGIYLDSQITREKILAEVLRVVEEFPGFSEAVVNACQSELESNTHAEKAKKAQLTQEIQQVEQKLQRMMKHFEESDDPALISQFGERIKQLRQKKTDLALELTDLDRQKKPMFVVPPWKKVRQMIHDNLSQWATESMDFTRVMRKIVPQIIAVPVELADMEGHIEFRGRLTINLTGLFGDKVPESFSKAATREVEIDLFNTPQRETYRKEVVSLFRGGTIIKNISQRLSIATAMVERSLKLQRCMDKLQIDDAYIRVHMIPKRQLGKMSRTLHRRYKFKPLEGFPVQ